MTNNELAISNVYFCDSGAVLPNFAVRQVADLFSLNQIVWGYVVLAFVAWLVVFLFGLSPKQAKNNAEIARTLEDCA